LPLPKDCRAEDEPRRNFCRKSFGQAKRLEELEQEKSKLKRLVANLSLDDLVLKDFASGNFCALSEDGSRQRMRSRRMG
jgi:hypothetical protein